MAKTKTPKERRQTKTAIGSNDPSLIAMMHVIATMAGDGWYVNTLMQNALVGTKEALRALNVSDGLEAGRFSSYAIVSRGVERCQIEADNKTDPGRREALALLRAVNGDDPTGEVGPIDGGVLMGTFNEYADAGMLFGACLMYALLKGGVR